MEAHHNPALCRLKMGRFSRREALPSAKSGMVLLERNQSLYILMNFVVGRHSLVLAST
jgi:hypothetical protein